MSYASYSQDTLSDLSFIAGNDFTFEFVVTESDGVTPMDISGSTVKWVLSPYGQPSYKVCQVEGVITDTNKFTVSLSSTLTKDLSGNYIHQPIIVALSGAEYRPAQGVLVVKPRIPYS